MDVLELLSIISNIAKENDISKPFIVGGTPRDRVMGEAGKNINDLDITTGDDGSIKLSELISEKLKNAKLRTYDDGHTSINFMGIRMDFSNNFVAPSIEEELKKQDVSNITSLKRELYSRDFTINTLLEDLSLSNIYDITGNAIGDIQAKLLRCPINPDITIGVDARRILRAIKFSIKYGFRIEDSLKNAMLKHRDKIRGLSERFVQDRIGEIVRLDNIDGVNMLIEYKILPLVPLTKPVYDVLIDQKKLNQVL